MKAYVSPVSELIALNITENIARSKDGMYFEWKCSLGDDDVEYVSGGDLTNEAFKALSFIEKALLVANPTSDMANCFDVE